MSRADENRATSIRQRINHKLRQRGEDVQFGLHRYAMERFLYRLGKSPHREQFVLKGGSLLALWGGNMYRPTRDLDFTGYGSAEKADILQALREICLQPDEGVELVFDPDSLVIEPIRDDSEYHGFRIRFGASLGGSKISMMIDIGFANAILPSAQDAEYPTLLDDAAPYIRTYPREAVVAEKLHAMVVLGERNSRFKDFYDMNTMAREFSFDGKTLAGAIAATFERRNTQIGEVLPVALTSRFYSDEARARSWRTYLDRNGLPGAPQDFTQVGEAALAFLLPMWEALTNKSEFESRWTADGPWEKVKK